MRLALALFLIAVNGPVAAIEIGDSIFLASSAAGLTVLDVRRNNGDTVTITAQIMATNASKYCIRNNNLKAYTPAYRKCVKENIGRAKTQILIDCRSVTLVILGSGLGSGAYRPSGDGGPWQAVTDPNDIIQGDAVFDRTCSGS